MQQPINLLLHLFGGVDGVDELLARDVSMLIEVEIRDGVDLFEVKAR